LQYKKQNKIYTIQTLPWLQPQEQTDARWKLLRSSHPKKHVKWIPGTSLALADGRSKVKHCTSGSRAVRAAAAASSVPNSAANHTVSSEPGQPESGDLHCSDTNWIRASHPGAAAP